jgi:hypothetical protein
MAHIHIIEVNIGHYMPISTTNNIPPPLPLGRDQNARNLLQLNRVLRPHNLWTQMLNITVSNTTVIPYT